LGGAEERSHHDQKEASHFDDKNVPLGQGHLPPRFNRGDGVNYIDEPLSRGLVHNKKSTQKAGAWNRYVASPSASSSKGEPLRERIEGGVK
jgi:hypothetical protein